MRALVTGANGFVGRWLTRHLREAGDDVWLATGPHWKGEDPRTTRLDVLDSAAVHRLVGQVAPDAIYHLAAVTSIPTAGRDPHRSSMVTIHGTINILEAASRTHRETTVLIPSSATVYASAEHDAPIRESHPLGPRTLYGASKMAQEAYAHAFAHRTRVCVTRSFNHIGPGQRSEFALPSFARQLAEISLRRAPSVLSVGNLHVSRDLTDVRDAVRAFRSVVASGESGPFNIASGVERPIREVLQQLIAISQLDVDVVTAPSLTRAGEVARLVGDNSALVRATGWRPTVDLGESLRDIWHEQLLLAQEATGSFG